MKIAFFALNQNFCGTILEELQAHHQVKNWQKYGLDSMDWANIKGLIDWCDLIYCDFIQEPCPEITRMQWLDKPMVVRMDGIDIMNHVNMDWNRVSAAVIMPVQMKRLMKLRADWERQNKRPLTKLPKIIKQWNVGIDLDLFQPDYARTPGYNIVLHASVMRATKQVYTALQVFAELIENDDSPWHMTLIGTWEGGWDWNNRKEYVTALHELLEQLNLGDRLTILPNLKREEWAEFIKTQDVIWGPSFREGFPNSVGEASASGVWPLINHFYGAELIYDSANICRSPIQLMKRTIGWGGMDDEAKINSMRYIRKHVEQYDRHKVAREIRQLCEEIVDEAYQEYLKKVTLLKGSE